MEEGPDLDELFGAPETGPAVAATMMGGANGSAGKEARGRGMEEGPDLDELFGAPETAPAVAATVMGGANGSAGKEVGVNSRRQAEAATSAPHPALAHAVWALFAQAWPGTSRDLRGGHVPEQAPAAPSSGQGLDAELADQLDVAAAAARAEDWPTCANQAGAVRAAAWAALLRWRAWPRACDRELFQLAELLLALAATARGDEAAAVRHADGTFIFSAAGGPFRDTALLFVRLLDDKVVAERRDDAAPLLDGICLPPAPPEWLCRKVPSGAALAPRAQHDGSDGAATALQAAAAACRPLVLEGLCRETAAFRLWAQLAYLDGIAGHRLVPVEVGAAVAGSDGWREEFMPMRRFLCEYLAPSCAYCSRKDVAFAATGIAYLAQHELLEQCPALRNDIAVPPICQKVLGAPARANAWLGTHGTVTPCHWDSYRNCLVQVQGAKRALLLPPEAAPCLHVTGPSGAETGGAGVAAQGNLSPVDLEAPDLGRFPQFASAPAVVVADLSPGDALFIPEGWWHQVHALSPSFSVNFWF